MKKNRLLEKILKPFPRVAYALGQGGLIGKSIILLITRNRRSNLPRATPLEYVQQGDEILITSPRSPNSAWLMDIQEDPRVQVQVGESRFKGTAEISSDTEKTVDTLQQLIFQNMKGTGTFLRGAGLSSPPSRAELMAYASKRPAITIRREGDASRGG